MRNLVSTVAVLATAFAAACSSDATTAPTAAPAALAPTNGLALSVATWQGTGTPAALASQMNTSLCMDVLGGSISAGATVGIWPCNGGANQTFTSNAAGELKVGSLCVDDWGAKGANGDAIVVWTCNGGANQRWTATATGQLRGINGRCLDIPGGNGANGTKLVLWDCNTGSNQRWSEQTKGQQPDQPAAPAAPAAPVAPPASIVVQGVAVLPGQSIQAAVNANPANTTFILKAGTHTNQSVVPKSGDVFYGETGTVLDGGGSAQYAFWTGANAPYPSNVTLKRLVIQNYAPPVQLAAVRAGGHGPSENSTGWVIDSCEVRNNSTGGVRIGNRTKVLRSFIHHNQQIGLGGIGDSSLVEGNEISYNGSTAYGVTFEVGATKFVQTRWLVVRGNFSHHNYGPGFWTDENNISTLYENNRVEDNATAGIFHEISYDVVIRNNQIARNGFTGSGWVYGGGITISASPNAEIYGNTVANNFNGITGVMQSRGSGTYGVHSLENMYVHDNTVTAPSGLIGIGIDIADLSYFSSRGNRYERNTYNIAGNARPFAWNNGTRTESEWRAFGLDVTGTFNR